MAQNREIPLPSGRRLRVFAFDPGLSGQFATTAVNEVVIEVPWESLIPEPDDERGETADPMELGRGPVGEYLEIIDFDPASGCFYQPVDLNDPRALVADGLAPSETDPRFHQQMVYAVARNTIDHFEKALGRRATWDSHRVRDEDGRILEEIFVRRLRIYPHALREANAYYSPQLKALLFGYFSAAGAESHQIPRVGMVFSCLSHGIIAHETAHALLDGTRRRFTEESNPDMLAFHEAFADLVALFQHFAFPEVLRHQIAHTRGALKMKKSLLGALAHQFGRAVGRRGALRDALGEVDEDDEWHPRKPDPGAVDQTTEPHERGAILVAAIFDAFLKIYEAQVEDLRRIATGGTGELPVGAIHPDLVNRMAREAAECAQHVLHMCIRALDYCPPVDLTFGDYLRAIITADRELVHGTSATTGWP